MSRKILSAVVSIQEDAQVMGFSTGINVLFGRNAEGILLTLAHIFGGQPSQNIKAEIQWYTDDVLLVSAEDGAYGVENVGKSSADAALTVKDFHKQRFLNFRNYEYIFDGSDIPAGFLGASDLLLKKLREAIDKEDDRPLFLFNFLERLDEAADLQAIFEALNVTGRQVFIAVPHYFSTKKLEEIEYGATIQYESSL